MLMILVVEMAADPVKQSLGIYNMGMSDRLVFATGHGDRSGYPAHFFQWPSGCAGVVGATKVDTNF
jgi:hypothetical protein